VWPLAERLALRRDFVSVKPSEEICRIIERWVNAIAEGDADAALARLSEQPGLLVIELRLP
jgi:hypothetical protein